MVPVCSNNANFLRINYIHEAELEHSKPFFLQPNQRSHLLKTSAEMVAAEHEGTGYITAVSKDKTLISSTIHGRQVTLPFHQNVFYSFGKRYKGELTHILKEGMRVCFRFTLSKTTNEANIVSVWLGANKPGKQDPDLPLSAVYSHKGRVRQYLDVSHFLVEADDLPYSVLVSKTVMFGTHHGRTMDGVELLDACITFDAVPLKVENEYGAKYMATCVWSQVEPGPSARFGIGIHKFTQLDENVIENHACGFVAVVVKEYALVHVEVEDGCERVLLFPNCFKEQYRRVQDLVTIGDTVCVSLGFGFIFHGCVKQWLAVKAWKCDDDNRKRQTGSSSSPLDRVVKVEKLQNKMGSLESNASETGSSLPSDRADDIVKPVLQSITTRTVSNDVPVDTVIGEVQKPEDEMVTLQSNALEMRSNNLLSNRVIRKVQQPGNETATLRSNAPEIGSGDLLSDRIVVKVEKPEDEMVIGTFDAPDTGSNNSVVVKVEKPWEEMDTLESNEPELGSVGLLSRGVDEMVTLHCNARETLSNELHSDRVVKVEKPEEEMVLRYVPETRTNNLHWGSTATVEKPDEREEIVTLGTVIKTEPESEEDTDEEMVIGESLIKIEEATIDDFKIEESAVDFDVPYEEAMDVSASDVPVSREHGPITDANLPDNVHGPTQDSVVLSGAVVSFKGTTDGEVLYGDPPHRGTLTVPDVHKRERGCILYNGVEIVFPRNRFFLYGCRCVRSQFVSMGKSKLNTTVFFEAVATNLKPALKMEYYLTCAWLGDRPSLLDIARPYNSKLCSYLCSQNFCVGKLENVYLPDLVLLLVQHNGHQMLVCAQISKFLSSVGFVDDRPERLMVHFLAKRCKYQYFRFRVTRKPDCPLGVCAYDVQKATKKEYKAFNQDGRREKCGQRQQDKKAHTTKEQKNVMLEFQK